MRIAIYCVGTYVAIWFIAGVSQDLEFRSSVNVFRALSANLKRLIDHLLIAVISSWLLFSNVCL